MASGTLARIEANPARLVVGYSDESWYLCDALGVIVSRVALNSLECARLVDAGRLTVERRISADTVLYRLHHG